MGLFSLLTGSWDRKWSMKSRGVTEARSHFSLFKTSSSICWVNENREDKRTSSSVIQTHIWRDEQWVKDGRFLLLVGSVGIFLRTLSVLRELHDNPQGLKQGKFLCLKCILVFGERIDGRRVNWIKIEHPILCFIANITNCARNYCTLHIKVTNTKFYHLLPLLQFFQPKIISIYFHISVNYYHIFFTRFNKFCFHLPQNATNYGKFGRRC